MSSATILDGRALAQELRATLIPAVADFSAQHAAPRLAVIQVAGNSASDRYVRSIEKLCAAVGIGFQLSLLPATASQAELLVSIATLNGEPSVDGLLLQLPLPAGLDAQAAILAIDYHKDVDGVHPLNAGLLAQGQTAFIPNTPAGGMELLRHFKIPLAGRRAAVIGRSAIVGRPMAALLTAADATVTLCHSRTADLGALLRECEIVCVAAGRAGLVSAEMIRPGAVVIDFGTNVRADGSLVGDVDFAAVSQVASAITPVPGGTGPVTNIMLLRNVLRAAEKSA